MGTAAKRRHRASESSEPENEVRVPKKRHAQSDDESDTGVKPKAAKKTKTGKAEGKDDEGNLYWQLAPTRRAIVQDFKGKTYVNIREYYVDAKDGKSKPGRKGIMLNMEQYQTLLSALPAINSALVDKGLVVDSDAAEPGPSSDEQSKKTKKSKKEKKSVKKANFDPTSDEDEE